MTSSPYLKGHLLLAMPGMSDPRFDRSVVLLCSHDETGAMGVVLNQPLSNMSLSSLMEQLDITIDEEIEALIHCGGPVEPGRGFVIHSADYSQDSTTVINEKLAVTATTDVLKAIANNEGPEHYVIALGYAGWSAGQLEGEIQQNSWMTSASDTELLFHTEADNIWPRAMAMLGIDISMLSLDSGHA
ncbi:YqgE/AlgH family protein [Temperatibacter marinus]|uniref:UPF0301 protein QGN29_14100 n=1 Tax=Temperatibacter marinus TaxID=1456591 RepID=A0AA52EII9_9PROT|nr:YqgE/AlgH family protein [Temperatibacter marinus]WND02681.1 YqgE/AlgH family protein [Temperatibacter marinus]